jgi:hypothetical protein
MAMRRDIEKLVKYLIPGAENGEPPSLPKINPACLFEFSTTMLMAYFDMTMSHPCNMTPRGIQAREVLLASGLIWSNRCEQVHLIETAFEAFEVTFKTFEISMQNPAGFLLIVRKPLHRVQI